MKALIFGGLWLGIGAWVVSRRSRPAGEALLTLLFWPFFLGGEEERPPTESGLRGPLARLHQALGGGDAAASVVVDLQLAVTRLEDRLGRVEAAMAELSQEGDGGGALAEARARSAELLGKARQRCTEELDAALAAVEETATRLVIARETGTEGEVNLLLDALRSRLQAAEEVAGVGEGAGPRLVAG